MGKRLVTIATFDQPTPAHLAKNALDEAGIQATVADASLVSMDWLLSNAIGGIKVQVWDETRIRRSRCWRISSGNTAKDLA